MIPRILNLQGVIGIAASLLLLGLCLVKAGEARHWRRQSGRYEQLYLGEQNARAQTVANYRAAAEAARAADLANADRAVAAQSQITERTSHDLETRLADARAHAERLQLARQSPATAQRSGRATPVPASSPTAGPPGRATEENGFSLAAKLSLEDRLTATEQAIQLDELIRWVKAQAAVAGDPATRPRPADQ